MFSFTKKTPPPAITITCMSRDEYGIIKAVDIDTNYASHVENISADSIISSEKNLPAQGVKAAVRLYGLEKRNYMGTIYILHTAEAFSAALRIAKQTQTSQNLIDEDPFALINLCRRAAGVSTKAVIVGLLQTDEAEFEISTMAASDKEAIERRFFPERFKNEGPL